MKTVKFIFVSMLAVSLMIGCKKDDKPVEKTVEITVTATIDGSLGIAWEPGDEIKVVCAEEVFTFVTSEGGTSAQFISHDENLSALMAGNNPISAYVNCSSIYGAFRVQSEQLVNGGVNATRIPLFAYTMNNPDANNLSLSFKPLASVLELEVEPFDIIPEKLVISPAAGAVVSNGAMAGGFTVDASKSTVTVNNAVSSITLDFGSGLNLSQGAKLRIPIGWFAIDGGLDVVFHQGTKTFAMKIWENDGLVRTFTDNAGLKQARLIRQTFEFDMNVLPRAYYVKVDGDASSYGLSWSAPTTLASALTNAVSGSTIHIAAGTYKPEKALTGRDLSDQTKTFEISRYITIIGGYPANATTGAVSNPATNKTIFDGDGKSFHTMVVSAPKLADEKVSITGITIKGGKNTVSDTQKTNINGFDLLDSYGAGLAPIGTSVELINCTISENEGSNAGGIYSVNSDVTIKECQISNNISNNNGAGAWITNGTNLKMQNTVIQGNRTTIETAIVGGLYLYVPTGERLSAEVTGCTISNNTAASSAAIYVRDDSGNQLLESSFKDCTIVDNTGSSASGSGGIINILNARTSFTNCEIKNNTSGSNGMICTQTNAANTLIACVIFDGCTVSGNKTTVAAVGAGIQSIVVGGGLNLIVLNSTFSGNISPGRGGAIYARNGTNLTCVNSTFSGNTCASYGSAIAMNGTAALPVNVTLIGCTLTGNHSSHTTAGCAVGLETVSLTLKTYNTIISGNTSPISSPDVYINGTLANTSATHNCSIIGDQLYNSAGTAGATSPTFVASTMLAALANNGGATLTHKLVGNASSNAAFGNGMTATALKAMATKDITATVLGQDQTGTARTDTDKIIGSCVK